MPFAGSLINTVCIIVFASLGALVKRVNRAVLCAVAIAVTYLGIEGALDPADGYLTTFFGNASLTKFIIVIVSLAAGTA